MECIEKLKEIGIERINTDTKITTVKIEAILKKKFHQIPSRVHFHGFIRILQDTYGIDFNELIQEYDVFYAKNKEKYEAFNKNLLPQESNEKKSKAKYFAFCILVILAIGFTFFKQIENRDNVDVGALGKNKTVDAVVQKMADQKSKVVIEEVDGENLAEKNKSATKDITTIALNITAQNTKDKVIEDAKLTEATLKKAAKSSSRNNTKDSMSKQYNQAKESKNLPQFSVNPRQEVWFRVTNLETGKQKDYLTKDKISIDLQGDVLILFGHGELSIQTQYNSFESETPNRIRIIIENGIVREITKKDYEQFLK